MVIQPKDNYVHVNPCAQEQVAVAASQYSYEELTDIYNQTRIDYIVPMPMSAHRMREYVDAYDVDLSASVVSFYDKTATGIGMLGLRDNRAWITRLGVIPNSRGRRNGIFLMDALFHQAQLKHVDRIQLEVISGNEPAHNLFHRYGFQETRELSIVRRPPRHQQHHNPLPNAIITALTFHQIIDLLNNNRPAGASWIDETSSILKKGQLFGYKLIVNAEQHGWVVFHSTSFQMGYFVMDATPELYDEIILSLLHSVHKMHSQKDTKIENVPVNHRLFELFQQAGYIESFRRIEMERFFD